MGLFSSSKSSSSTTTETKDNRVGVEGAILGTVVSPEASLTQTFQGDYGLSGGDVAGIVGDLISGQSQESERLTNLTRNITEKMTGQTDKLAAIIEGLKSDGASWSKFLPYAVVGFLIYKTMKGTK